MTPTTLLAGIEGCTLVFTLALAYYRHSKNEITSPGSISTPSAWKVKLETLRRDSQISSKPILEVPGQECLTTLSFIAQKGIQNFQMFKQPFHYEEPLNEKMKTLVEVCESQDGEALYLSIAHAFLDNLPALNAFIRAETEGILLQENPTKEDYQRFKTINQQIRTILLFLMSHEPKKQDYLQAYEYHIKHAFGNREWKTVDRKQPIHYFDHLKSLKKTEENIALDEFLFSFSIYRRHALLRLFPEKIQERSQCQDIGVKTLLSATWFHGTRAVTSLSDTDFILMPSGWLRQVGLTSFFGEMAIGNQLIGVNAHSLSGTYLDCISQSGNYAYNFQFKIKNELNLVTQFLERKFDVDINSERSLCGFLISTFSLPGIAYADEWQVPTQELSTWLPRLLVAFQRYARWEPIEFEKIIPILKKQLSRLQEIVDVIESKQPPAIFESSYYLKRYQSIKPSIGQIDTFLNASLPPALTEQQKINIEANFPAILGSLTLLSSPTRYDDCDGEHLVRGSAELGKDIQLLCVYKQDMKKAQKWINTHLPNANIQLFSFDTLSSAYRINMRISPYLADIFSLKKFQALVYHENIPHHRHVFCTYL